METVNVICLGEVAKKLQAPSPPDNANNISIVFTAHCINIYSPSLLTRSLSISRLLRKEYRI